MASTIDGGSALKTAWLGYRRNGGRFEVRQDEMGHGIVLLGHGAKELATLLAYACNEAGMKALVLDLDGYVSGEVSGYIDAYDISYFLYDACRVSERTATHAQLAASAYASILNLSYEQEAIINAAMQKIAAEKGTASPSGVVGFLGATEGFKGSSVDQLRGRLTYLRALDMMGESGAVEEMVKASGIANFSRVEPPEAAELGTALLLSKIASAEDSNLRPDVIVVTDSHRLFPHHAIVNHSARLLTTLLSARIAKVFSSDLPRALDKTLVGSCHTKISSSAAWNETTEGIMLTPNMFMAEDSAYGHFEPLIPREYEPSRLETKGGATDLIEDRAMVKIILATIASNSVTRQSLVGWLSVEYPASTVEKALDRLYAQGDIASRLTDAGGSAPTPTLSLTETGRGHLEELR